MEINITTSNPLEHATPALIIGCFEDDGSDIFFQADTRLDGYLGHILSSKAFEGKLSTSRMVDTLGKLPAERLLLLGLGKKDELSNDRIRQAAGYAMQVLKGGRIARFTSLLQLAHNSENAVEAVCEGAILGSYAFDQYKTKDKDKLFCFEEMTLLFPDDKNIGDICAKISRSETICGGVRLARDLVSHPGNVATTGYLAESATEMAIRLGIECRIYEKAELEELGMNALVAVGKGSEEPPRLIVLEYRGGDKKSNPVVLVGKGITFDSGGISIKPGAGMEEMKTDMAGGAAVLGAISAVAGLKLPVNLVAIVPTAENMPDGKAYRPGDVLTAMSGTTIEITNTDAEGRLILCDALHFAQRYNPAALIDLATLTGACVVALGHETSGMMGNDQQLMGDLQAAGERSGERLWQLPLWDEYGEAMKSDIADLKNAGSRDGGTITAGWFLKQFVGETKWVHLDIAGTAWNDKPRPYSPKGASGVGVRMLIEYLKGA